MKKAILFIITITLLLLLSSCKPDGMNNSMYQLGLNALKVTDQYIDGEMGADETKTRLEEYSNQASKEYEALKANETNDTKDLLVEIEISSLRFDFGYSQKSMTEVIEDRNSLAEALGKTKR